MLKNSKVYQYDVKGRLINILPVTGIKKEAGKKSKKRIAKRINKVYYIDCKLIG